MRVLHCLYPVDLHVCPALPIPSSELTCVLHCLYPVDLHVCPALPIPSRLTCVSCIAYTLRQTHMCVLHCLYLEADLHACPALPIP